MAQEQAIELGVNLADANRSSRNIGLDWSITIPKREKGFFAKLFSSGADKIEKNIVLKLEDFSKPYQLVTHGPLITLIKDGNPVNQDQFPINLTLNNLVTTFTVFLNEQNILDYTDPHDREAVRVPVSFTIVAQDQATGEIIDSVKVTLNLILAKIETEPEIEFDLFPEVQYDSTKQEEYVGSITIRSTAKLSYAAPVKVAGSVHATLNQKESSNLIQLKLKKDGGFGSEPSLVEVDAIDPLFLSRGEEITYDLFLKMNQMVNPRTDSDKLDVKFMGTYLVGHSSIDHKHLNVLTESCDVLQDTQGSEVSGSFNGEPFENGGNIQMEKHNFFALGPLMKEIPLTFKNLAKDKSNPRAGVKIFNFAISADLTPGVKLYDKDGRLMDIQTSGIFKLDCSKPEIFGEEGVFLPNGMNKDGDYNSVDVKVQFTSKNISAVKGSMDYNFDAFIHVTFDYYENKHGLRDEELLKTEPGKFSMDIRLPLFLLPNSQWLCVDYGTSAIVCLYDNEIIDLRKRKENIIAKAIDDAKLRLDNFEKGSKFLSSDIIFHNTKESETVSSLATEQEGNQERQYNDLTVFLSPTSSMYVNETLRLLPCLKLLVGNEVLPKNKYLYPHQYNRKTRDGRILRVTLDRDVDHETSLMKIDQIFRQSYEALFRYYISKEVPDRNSIHRLVLTYPNTYTPRHIKTLRQVVESAFPSVRKLEFVSESDAIAAYYLSHWYDYNDMNADIHKNENILVFDMGAGTLDISYIDKSSDRDGKIKMRILGKLGTSKAGNYLDFVLAQVVSDITGLPKSVATTDAPLDEEESADRTKLKLFVKTELKPILNKENANKKLKYNEFEFKVQEVLDYSLFQDYLKACTNIILKRLVNYMQSSTGHLKIDTVLMSGRSCLLEPLQQMLKTAIAEIADPRFAPRFLVLDNPMRCLDGNKERQKTAVAQGAMEMADNYRRPESTISVLSRRHYASFGVVYDAVGGRKIYREILNHSDIPGADNLNQFDSDSVVIDGLNVSHTLTLVQTYLSAEDTQKALEKGDYELVTEMEIIDTAALGRPKSVEIKLRINEYNDIILCFGKQSLVTEGHQPKGEDLQSEETKRSIWPVTI